MHPSVFRLCNPVRKLVQSVLLLLLIVVRQSAGLAEALLSRVDSGQYLTSAIS